MVHTENERAGRRRGEGEKRQRPEGKVMEKMWGDQRRRACPQVRVKKALPTTSVLNSSILRERERKYTESMREEENERLREPVSAEQSSFTCSQ